MLGRRHLRVDLDDGQHVLARSLVMATGARWRELDHLSRALFWQTHSFVLPTILRSYDRYGMSASVEIRMPFLDWRVATFAFALASVLTLLALVTLVAKVLIEPKLRETEKPPAQEAE